jgi:hypothetical protein
MYSPAPQDVFLAEHPVAAVLPSMYSFSDKLLCAVFAHISDADGKLVAREKSQCRRHKGPCGLDWRRQSRSRSSCRRSQVGRGSGLAAPFRFNFAGGFLECHGDVVAEDDLAGGWQDQGAHVHVLERRKKKERERPAEVAKNGDKNVCARTDGSAGMCVFMCAMQKPPHRALGQARRRLSISETQV